MEKKNTNSIHEEIEGKNTQHTTSLPTTHLVTNHTNSKLKTNGHSEPPALLLILPFSFSFITTFHITRRTCISIILLTERTKFVFCAIIFVIVILSLAR